MAGPVLWGPNSIANNLESALGFSNGAGPTVYAPASPVDPSFVATSGNKGDLYLNNSNARYYVKNDSGSSVNWSLIPTSFVTVQTASYSILPTDCFVEMSSASATTATLPTAISSLNKSFTVINTGAGVVTVQTASGGTLILIPGGTTSTTYALATKYTSVTLVSDGGSWLVTSATGGPANALPPTQTIKTSGSGTYFPPSNAYYLRVRMVGGGGGGSPSGTGTSAAGNNGGATSLGTSILTAGGGIGGDGSTTGNQGGLGGTATISGSGVFGTAIMGGQGGGGSFIQPGVGTNIYVPAGTGAPSPFGGGAAGGAINSPGFNANANSGAGGGGGGWQGVTMTNVGAGGGAGGFIDAIVTGTTLSTWISSGAAFVVDPGGPLSSAGTAGSASGAGGSGYIEITEYYPTSGTVISGSGVTIDLVGAAIELYL